MWSVVYFFMLEFPAFPDTLFSNGNIEFTTNFLMSVLVRKIKSMFPRDLWKKFFPV